MTENQNPAPAEPARSRRPRRSQSPGVRYLGRLTLALAVYGSGLVGAIAIAHSTGGGGATWVAGLLTVPGIVLGALAVLGYYREADELERRKLAEAILIAFSIGTPAVLAIGVMQDIGVPRISWTWAFVVYMAGWLIGAAVTGIRYR